MSMAYFISDAHLGVGKKEEERAKEHRLVSFLSFLQKDANQLFIVGDLFDAWFEYRTVIPKGFHRILTKLEELTEQGILVHYLAGNHDYWIRDYFHDELRVKTYHEAFDVTIDGKRIFIHHGDGLAKNDAGYRILKPILRNRINIWLYSWLHPDIGIVLARASSRQSRHYTSSKSYGEEDGMLALATEKIRVGYDAVIMGHRHDPVCKRIENGLYINLGDWITHNTYAQMENGQLTLNRWSI